MNDDDPRQVLELLKTEHRRLDEEIDALVALGSIDQLREPLRLADVESAPLFQTVRLTSGNAEHPRSSLGTDR